MSAPKQSILMPAAGPRRNFRRRRRHPRRTAALAAVLVLALVVVALALDGVVPISTGGTAHRSTYLAASQAGGGGRHGSPGAHASSKALASDVSTGTGALSALGLPLDPPALQLRGLRGTADPVQESFRPEPRAGVLFDLDSGRVLWARNPYERVPIASLTKMMTALMTVQSTSPSARILVTKEARDAEGSKVGVLPLGREVPVETMMYGLLLPSGNDAAVALAEHIAGTVTHFVQEMNEEAALLGLGCTRYSTPSGYVDHDNFSCPADLAVLAHDDLAEERIARIVHTAREVLPFPIKGGKLFLYNNNPILIYGYPGATGLKTGYTEAAGRCLVATAERHGVRLGVVLLDSSAPGTQAQRLLDDGFGDVYHLPPVREPPIPAGV